MPDLSHGAWAEIVGRAVGNGNVELTVAVAMAVFCRLHKMNEEAAAYLQRVQDLMPAEPTDDQAAFLQAVKTWPSTQSK